jgi:3-(3-hydroxy-phenyl)propionate hydroxylase
MSTMGANAHERETLGDFDVAIVGLGPVGGTLACLLGQLNINVLVLEREAAPYALPRAVAFDAEVMRVFQTIGLTAEIMAATRVSPGMIFIDSHGRKMLEWLRPEEPGPQGWHESYRFHQPDLEALLRKTVRALPAVTVVEQHVVTEIVQDEQWATIRSTDLKAECVRMARARYVIGCDGARSITRDLLKARYADLGFEERWVVVDCLLTRPRPDLGDYSVQFCDPDRPATYVRGVGNRRRWEIRAPDAKSTTDLTKPDMIWSLLSRWIRPDDAEIERAAVYTFRSAVATQWRNGRLLIAGDAAHLTPPFLGQGLCAGIRDVSNLAWKLAAVLHNGVPDGLLDTYQNERAPHVTEFIELAVRLGGLINLQAKERAVPGHSFNAEPATMSAIKPKLGATMPGAHPLVGTLAPQPRLASGHLVDDRVGYSFCIIALSLDAEGDADLKERCRERGVAVILASRDEPAAMWLRAEGIVAALIRPDRYILAVAAREADRLAMLSAEPVRYFANRARTVADEINVVEQGCAQ